MPTIECPNENCDMVYHLLQVNIPVRDKDSIECKNCGTTIIRWNGDVVYTITGTTTKDKIKNIL